MTVRAYLDASALVKLVQPEVETDALRAYLGIEAKLLSSRIAAVEVRRAVARGGEAGTGSQVNAVLRGVEFVELDVATADVAGSVSPMSLRSLDAIHLASAIAVADELQAFVTYDSRLADAARAVGLTVVAPA